ncbi:hypothetical protein NQ318_015167 [Aromia moschata]|uniref:Uncharacterized protein n=1 Tax=Aromia moschata TaxID=1265417 RepID=A0AAV8XYE4_9CUCU|nr:hypothetical protein NQ318_015167 [Aromia moschata]
MYFMHDGAPPHFARIVREYLNEQFPGRWIGINDAPISWPPRSPDLILAISSFENEETLRRLHFNFLRMIDFYINENGGHFEHLIKSQ